MSSQFDVESEESSVRELSDIQHQELAREMYERWKLGEPKSRLEHEYWDNTTSHGKAFTSYIKRWLDLGTEKKSPQTEYIEHLETRLRALGVEPVPGEDLDEEHRLLASARESAVAALRIYNDPGAGFRTQTFIVLMIIAWNSLLQAILERDGLDYFEKDNDGETVSQDGRPKVLDTWTLISEALGKEQYRAVRANLDFFLKLRHHISHRYLPAIDQEIVGEAQAMLLNFETLLADEFGNEAALGDRLIVALQLSRFRTDVRDRALKDAQAFLPADVMARLQGLRDEVSDDVLRDPAYSMRIFFAALTANRDRSADAVVTFVRPGELDPELEKTLAGLAVVTKPKQVPVASGDLLRPSEVVELVSEELPFRFTMDTHTRSWKFYRVRPPTDAAEKESTNPKYCKYDRLSRGYGFTQAWVKFLIAELSTGDQYELVVGLRPDED